jgi:RNA polymerase subunit RPABC4/transcription elongation factor Spt4
MNKEIIIAISVGFALGLFAALAILFAPKMTSRFQKKPMVRVDEKTTSDEKREEITGELIIIDPEDRFIVKNSPITVSGKSAPESKIVILSQIDQKAKNADKKGKFTTKIKLLEGRNDIQIASYKDGKDTQVKTVIVYYSKKL